MYKVCSIVVKVGDRVIGTAKSWEFVDSKSLENLEVKEVHKAEYSACGSCSIIRSSDWVEIIQKG